MQSKQATFSDRALRLLQQAVRRARWRLACKLHKQIVVKTNQGLFTTFADDWAIGRALFEEGGYEFDESLRALQFLKSRGFIPRTDVLMYDIGANIGIISIGLLNAGEIDFAVAIEPDPDNFYLLQKNVAQNQLTDKLLSIQTAISSEPATLTMHHSKLNRGDHRTTKEDIDIGRGKITVPAVTLDDICSRGEATERHFEKPHLLWMDVQGFEGHILAGAEETICNGIPVVLEVSPYGLIAAGTQLESFAAIVQSKWTHFWIESQERFVPFPISVFDCLLDFIGPDENHYLNVILTSGKGLARDELL